MIPFRYQGQYEDTETGLYYNRFRYYDADSGVYVSQDPIGLLGDKSSLYSYVNNPNNSIDPFGLIEILSTFGVSVHAYPGPAVGGVEHLNPLLVHMYEGGLETKIALEDFTKDGKQKQQKWNCHNVKNILLKFFNKEKYIDFREITPAKFEQFEKWMIESGRKLSTTAVYSGIIRTMFRQAFGKQVISEDLYPFGRGKFIIPQVISNKRALQTMEIKAIYQYKAEPFFKTDYARDFWVFSYTANRMNMADICGLIYKDINKETFSFIRHKTKEKNKNCRTITVPITDDISQIIIKWGNKD